MCLSVVLLRIIATCAMAETHTRIGPYHEAIHSSVIKTLTFVFDNRPGKTIEHGEITGINGELKLLY
jgi:hypothetical protein